MTTSNWLHPFTNEERDEEVGQALEDATPYELGEQLLDKLGNGDYISSDMRAALVMALMKANIYGDIDE